MVMTLRGVHQPEATRIFNNVVCGCRLWTIAMCRAVVGWVGRILAGVAVFVDHVAQSGFGRTA